MSLLIPCEHLSAEAYTALVRDNAAAIIGVLQQNTQHFDGGLCSAVVEDTIDQVVVHYLKLLGSKQPAVAESYLDGLVAKIQYHGMLAIKKTKKLASNGIAEPPCLN